MGDPRQLQPGLQGDNRASGTGRAAADFDLAPAGLSAQGPRNPFVGKELDPAGRILGLIAADVEPDDFGAAQKPGCLLSSDWNALALAQE